MVAYNFQKRFAPAIKAGEKTHTIRRNGKRRHARPGEALQLYTGMRTAHCAKIIDDPVCRDVKAIEIHVGFQRIGVIRVGQMKVDDIDAFAIADGFKDAADMHAFWLDFHGPGWFNGSFISWGE